MGDGRTFLLQLDGWEAIVGTAVMAAALVLIAARGITVRLRYKNEHRDDPDTDG